MHKIHEQALLNEIRDFLRRTGMSRSRFGWLAMRDMNFIRTLEEGRELRSKSREKVRAVLDSQDEDAE